MRSTQEAINEYIESHLPTFHQKRLESLEGLKLDRVLARKNPYLFKAKHLETAGDLVKQLLDAHLSSQEETTFGDFLEALAIHVCAQAFDGKKSTTEGIDLEFSRDGGRYIVSIKSGPNWGNSAQIKKMRDHFRQARRIARQPLIAINGCCYGRDNAPEKGDYRKLCGQAFWSLISGNDAMYQDIVEPLGNRAKARNEEFAHEYAKVVNRFTREFAERFCREDGVIDWTAIVAFNSATTKPTVRTTQPAAKKAAAKKG